MNNELEEIIKLIRDLDNYNQRVAQIFHFTFEQIEAEGKNPFVIENDELIRYIKKRYNGVLDE